MDLSVSIPDDIVPRLHADRKGLERRAFEAFVAEEYRIGHLHKADLRRLLGYETGMEIDKFLKDHGVMYEYTIEDLERERASLKSFFGS